MVGRGLQFADDIFCEKGPVYIVDVRRKEAASVFGFVGETRHTLV